MAVRCLPPQKNLAVFFFPFFEKSRQTKEVPLRQNFFFILVLLSAISVICAPSYGFRILIDPGHGGNDRGAFHFNQKEKKLTLQLAQKVREKLRGQKPAWHVQLTRENDQYISLEKRVDMSEPFDLMISLHGNSSELSSIEGMEVYFQPDQKIDASSILEAIVNDLKSNAKTQQSLMLSKKLQDNWTFSPSIIRRTPFYVVEKGAVPSVLIEVGFMSNPSELKKLLVDSYQEEIAQSIVNALVAYHSSLE